MARFLLLWHVKPDDHAKGFWVLDQLELTRKGEKSISKLKDQGWGWMNWDNQLDDGGLSPSHDLLDTSSESADVDLILEQLYKTGISPQDIRIEAPLGKVYPAWLLEQLRGEPEWSRLLQQADNAWYAALRRREEKKQEQEDYVLSMISRLERERPDIFDRIRREHRAKGHKLRLARKRKKQLKLRQESISKKRT